MSVPNPFDELLNDVTDTILFEYDRGFSDAFNAITAGLEASLEKAKDMSDAKPLLLGLESAVYVVKGLKEELDKVRNTEPETTGEKSDG